MEQKKLKAIKLENDQHLKYTFSASCLVTHNMSSKLNLTYVKRS